MFDTKKDIWKFIIQVLAAIITAAGTALGTTSCMGAFWTLTTTGQEDENQIPAHFSNERELLIIINEKLMGNSWTFVLNRNIFFFEHIITVNWPRIYHEFIYNGQFV